MFELNSQTKNTSPIYIYYPIATQTTKNNPCHTMLKTKFAPQHLLELKNNPKIVAPNSHAKHE
jgi:hypothetical protein